MSPDHGTRRGPISKGWREADEDWVASRSSCVFDGLACACYRPGVAGEPCREGTWGTAASRSQAYPGSTPDADRCDFIAEPNNGLCLLPFPDDYYTVADPSSPPGGGST